MRRFTEDEFDDELLDDGDELRDLEIPVIDPRKVRESIQQRSRARRARAEKAAGDLQYDEADTRGYEDYGEQEEDAYYGDYDYGTSGDDPDGEYVYEEREPSGRDRDRNRKRSGNPPKNSGQGRRSRRKRRRASAIPALVAVFLILLIVGGAVVMRVIEKNRYSDERESITTQFPSLPDEAVVIRNGELTDDTLKIVNSALYFTLDQAHELAGNTRLYKDPSGLLLYAAPTEIISASPGDAHDSSGKGGESGEAVTFTEKDGTTYVSAGYLRNYARFSYTLYTDPYRVSILTEDVTIPLSRVRKDTHIRVSGDRKSPILEDIARSDRVRILEEDESDWTKVMSEDGVTGYIEDKDLSAATDETLSPDSDYKEPEYPSIHINGTVNMGFLQVFGQSGESLLEEKVNASKTMNVIAPTWMSVEGGEGAIQKNGTSSFVKKAHGMGIQVWAALDDFNSGTADTPSIFRSMEKRKALIDNVMAHLNETGCDGLNLDFENIPEECGEDYVQFIREMSIACRQNGKVFSIDNYVPTDATDHHDRKEQGVVADYVVIMGYDEHYSGSSVAGSVASIDFVKQGIENTLLEVPADKIINAVPFYCRGWATTNGKVEGKAFGMEAAKEYADNHKMDLTWDDSVCQFYGETVSGETVYQLWLEDAESISAKLSVMKAAGIAGVAEWRLGLETADVWDVIDEYVSSPKGL